MALFIKIDDLSGLVDLLQQGMINPHNIVAIMGKTKGNWCVNILPEGLRWQRLKDICNR